MIRKPVDKIQLKNPEKILIVKPSSLGDIVHSLPFLNILRTCYPKAEIHWVIAKGFEGLLEGHPMISKLWIINKDSWTKMHRAKETIDEIRSLCGALKKERYDLVVDLQGLLRSGIITSATGAPVRVGFKEAREGSRFFYTHKVAGGKGIHAVDRYLKVAEYLGCDTSIIAFPFPLHQFPAIQSDKLPFHDYAVIAPGARWRTKRWLPEQFGKLASLLPLNSIVVGSKGDMHIADEIVVSSDNKALSLAGKTDLQELIEIIKGAKFMISNDSGPMHIAAALGVPVYAIFGPTDPLRTGPYGKGHTIIRGDVSCAPCFKRKCNDMKCMKNISAEKVRRIMNLSSS
jgi:lipopolysaccharide heptosyltransferase I